MSPGWYVDPPPDSSVAHPMNEAPDASENPHAATCTASPTEPSTGAISPVAVSEFAWYVNRAGCGRGTSGPATNAPDPALP